MSESASAASCRLVFSSPLKIHSSNLGQLFPRSRNKTLFSRKYASVVDVKLTLSKFGGKANRSRYISFRKSCAYRGSSAVLATAAVCDSARKFSHRSVPHISVSQPVADTYVPLSAPSGKDMYKSERDVFMKTSGPIADCNLSSCVCGSCRRPCCDSYQFELLRALFAGLF